jgi:serine protease Do
VDTSLSAVAEIVRRSVVQVRPDGPGGAGVALSRAGELVVVTNAHVARGKPGERIHVVSHGALVYPALIERMDAGRDLALLTLSPRSIGNAEAPSPATLSPATLGDVSTLRPGHLLVAVGHPFGLANAVTAGIVQAVGRVPNDLERVIGRRGRSWIQADIRLAPGNSGGPLCDMEGRVVGINTMVAGGLALAIPAAEVRAFLQELGEAIPA